MVGTFTSADQLEDSHFHAVARGIDATKTVSFLSVFFRLIFFFVGLFSVTLVDLSAHEY